MTFEEPLCQVSVITQATFAYSNSTMETPEKCVKSVQSLQKRYQSDVRHFTWETFFIKSNQMMI